MNTAIATVLTVTGQAWARDEDGNLREIQPGDTLFEGEVLITSDNGTVRLDFFDGEAATIDGGQEIAMVAELVENEAPGEEETDDASVLDDDVDALLAAIDSGEEDLLEVLDPAAAGGGGADGGGHGFVRLARISLDVDPQAYQFPGASLLDEAQDPNDTFVLEPDDGDDGDGGASVESITLQNAGDEAIEGTPLIYDVTLSNPPGSDVTFTFELGGGTATPGDDYGDPTFSNGVTLNDDGTITVPEGVSDFTVTVPTVDDNIDEPDETVPLVIDDVPAVGTIIDNDDPTVIITDPNDPGTATDNIDVIEGDDAVFTVDVADAAAGSSLDLSLTPETATEGADYSPAFEYSTDGGTTWTAYSDAITLEEGDSAVQVRTTTVDDTIDEPDETFRLDATLTSAGADYAADATATIIDNDEPPTIQIPAEAVVSEEGLAGGLPDDTGNPDDTTNSTTYTGSVELGGSNPLSVTLSEPAAELTSDGQTVNWSLSDDGQTLIGYTGDTAGDGNDVLAVNINNSGEYEVDLLGPVDHPDTTSEDVLGLAVGVNVSDGVNDTVSADLTINIEHDSPGSEPVTDEATAPSLDSNVMLILDTSGSMAVGSGVDDENGNELSRLEVMQQSVSRLLDSYDDLGDVKVQLVTFESGSESPTPVWVDIATAKEIVDGLSAIGGTNYDAALEEAREVFGSDGKIEGAQNVSYFLSDGNPTLSDENSNPFENDGTETNPGLGDGIDAGEEALWEDFLNANGINSYAIGVGENVSETYLEPIGHDGSTGEEAPGNTVVVTNLDELGAVLSDTVGGETIEGSLFSEGGAYGADGPGFVQSIAVDGVTYTYDGDNVTASDGSSVDFNNGVLTVTTGLSATLELNLEDGSYEYTPRTVETGTDTIDYTIVDADGDPSSSSLTINVEQAPGPMQLTATSEPLEVTLGLHGEYYGYNDNRDGSPTDDRYDGETDTRQHPDDGSATATHLPKYSDLKANLDTIEEVAAIIEGRAPGILGTGQHASATATDATFIATTIDYDIGFDLGDDNVEEHWNLGRNPKDTEGGVDSGNLYRFLGHDGNDDRDSIEVTTGLGETTDAIVRLAGSVYLDDGSYDIRVTSDDGFRMTIGGQEVAQYDEITPPLTTVTENVALTGGFQDIEMLYWDQAERSELKVELKRSGQGDDEYKTLSTENFALFGEDPQPDLEDNQTIARNDDGSFSIVTGADYDGDETGNTVFGTEASDTIDGRAGDDLLAGNAGNDTLLGGAGNDGLAGGVGDDVLAGGEGNDLMTGGLGADTFAWNLGDQGSEGDPAQDVITDFSADEGDKLDLSDLLQGEENNAGNLENYLHFEADGDGGTVVHVSSDGGFAGGYDAGATDQTIQLSGVQYSGSDAEIVQQMLGGKQLDVDS